MFGLSECTRTWNGHWQYSICAASNEINIILRQALSKNESPHISLLSPRWKRTKALRLYFLYLSVLHFASQTTKEAHVRASYHWPNQYCLLRGVSRLMDLQASGFTGPGLGIIIAKLLYANTNKQSASNTRWNWLLRFHLHSRICGNDRRWVVCPRGWYRSHC